MRTARGVTLLVVALVAAAPDAILDLAAQWWPWAVPRSVAYAADRTNVPLKNWGGFAIYRDAVYDDLERLVTAGLADRALLNTKPLSRVDAARIVARAIENIRKDEVGRYNSRGDLEPVLDRLMAEFRSELADLRVQVPMDLGPGNRFVSLTPIDRAQVRAALTTRDLSVVNNQAQRLQTGINGAVGFESRAQIGDVLTFYLHPELQGNGEYVAARLVTGYLKLTLFNVELLVGRDSIWWGPGFHGSLLFSNNGPPLDQVRLGTAEPLVLPWIGEYVGPIKLLAFLAALEKDRDIPRAKLYGMRGTVSPFRWLEIGGNFANMFDGDTPPKLKVSEYPQAIFGLSTSDQEIGAEKFRNNIAFSVDAEARFSNVDRYLVPARDLRVYVEFGWDDTCCETAFIPDLEASSFLAGVHFLGLFQQEGLDLRFEVTKTNRLSFTHNQFTRGWWSRGEVLSHFIGTDGLDVFARVTKRLSENLMIGFQANWAEIGNTFSTAPAGEKERRVGGGLDVSYRFKDRYAIFVQSQAARVENRNFKSGDDGFDYLLRLELTRSFR